MSGVYTRRQYLATAGTAVVLTGCNDRDDQTPTEAETLTATPVQQLVIRAGEEHTESSVPVYTGIEWYDVGRLVLEADAGFRLSDVGGTND